MAADPKTVTISMVQSASNACRHVKDGDILVKVNDIYVLDRDAARKVMLLVESICNLLLALLCKCQQHKNGASDSGEIIDHRSVGTGSTAA